MGHTSVRTVMEHPDFARVLQSINQEADRYQRSLSGHPATVLLAARAAKAWRRKELRRRGFAGMYCSRMRGIES